MSARRRATGDPRTVVDVMRAAVDTHGDTEAYVEYAEVENSESPRRHLTFGEWDRAADGVAGLFASHGVAKGDVVCLVLPSSIDYAVCYAAAIRLGAVTSGINPRLGPAELESVVARTGPAVTVLDRSLNVALPTGAGRIIGRDETAAAWDGLPPARFPELAEDDAVAVVWTSGTTGRPKGAVFDHANLKAVAAGTDVLSRPGDRRLSPLPFPHVGYMTRTWDEVEHAVTTVITPGQWRAAEALRILEDECITVGQGVPTQWALILALPELDSADLTNLRVAGTGAARVPAALVAEMRRRLGVPVVVRYTSTETSLGTGTAIDDPDEVVATTVGRPVPGVELCITDEDGRPVPNGTVGRVRIRSGAAMRGYWADPPPGVHRRSAAELIDREATAGVIDSEGFVITGDYGSFDEAGNLRLAGRANELYIRGGYNVFPAEVEDVLAAHPAVERAAVIGAPDPVLGEVGVAFVELTAGTPPTGAPQLADLRALCSGRLADYKAPDALVVVGSMPLTPMMKVDKRALADAAEEAAAARPRARSGAAPARAIMVADRNEEEPA